MAMKVTPYERQFAHDSQAQQFIAGEPIGAFDTMTAWISPLATSASSRSSTGRLAAVSDTAHKNAR